MKKKKIIGLLTAAGGVILVIKTIPLLAWYIILGILVLGVVICSILDR